MNAAYPHEQRLRGRGDAGPAARGMALCAVFLLVLTLAGCHSSTSRVAAPEHAPPAGTHEPEDASYDWHALVVAPFGSVLKEVPLTLHEVLLFKDESHGADAGAPDAECYAADSPAPRFVGRTPDEYLLCFRQDRLSRIQASVRLTAAQAPDVFAAACARWTKNAGPSEGACAGRDGPVRFSGRLEEESGRSDVPQTADPAAMSVLSITLDSVPTL